MALSADIPIGTSPTSTPREIAEAAQGAAVADAAALTATLTGVDTGTDMTSAQAATIVADLLTIHTQLNALIASLETSKIIAS